MSGLDRDRDDLKDSRRLSLAPDWINAMPVVKPAGAKPG